MFLILTFINFGDNMRGVIVYFMYLWFLLLGGGQLMHAYTLPKNIVESPSWDFVKKHQIRYKTLDSSSVLIEDADLDLDEEFFRGDNLDNGNTNTFVVVNKQSLLDNWYLTFSSQFIFKEYIQKNKITATPCGYSSPIYLAIGVLRI